MRDSSATIRRPASNGARPPAALPTFAAADLGRLADRLAAIVVDRVIDELRRRRQEPEPLAVSEAVAAEMLSLCPRTLYSLRRTGRIPHTFVGSKIVYPIDGLRQWLAERSQPRGEPAPNDVEASVMHEP